MGLKIIYEDNQVEVDGYGSASDLMQAYTCITHMISTLLTDNFKISKMQATAMLADKMTEAVNMPAEMFEDIIEPQEMPDEFREVAAP